MVSNGETREARSEGQKAKSEGRVAKYERWQQQSHYLAV